jgi:cytochrome c oxidase subunit 2
MNNKIIVAIIILLSLGIFAWLVDYGWQNRYGSPDTYQESPPKILTVNYQDEVLALKEDDVFAVPIWQKIPVVELELSHQITEKPWPKGLIPAVKVQAFHNGNDIYFKMTWEDVQADTTVAVDAFTDGCAVAVPLDAEAPLRSIMMGFSSPVNIWHWKAEKDIQYWQGKTNLQTAPSDFTYPFENEEILSVSVPELKSAVTDLLAQRAGSLTRKDNQIVQGRGAWQDGTWSVLFKRSLKTGNSQQDCQFPWGKHSASFAVWDGNQSDRGSRKSLSDWVNLQIEPPNKLAGSQAKNDNCKTHVSKITWFDKLRAFSLLSTASGATVEDQTAKVEKEPRIITVIAKRFEYQPNRIPVQKGELVTIRMESLDVTHGLYLDGYGVDIKARPGLIGKATFVADKPGRFSFRCSETCGEFHPYMIGFFEVSPNNRFNLFVWVIGITFMIMLGLVLFKGKQEKGVETNVGTEQ